MFPNKENVMSHVYRLPHIRLTASVGLMAIFSTLGLLMLPLPLAADGPGRGFTAQFEIDFLKFTIDHHFGALRMTELAAGTTRSEAPESLPRKAPPRRRSFLRLRRERSSMR